MISEMRYLSASHGVSSYSSRYRRRQSSLTSKSESLKSYGMFQPRFWNLRRSTSTWADVGEM